MSVDIGHGRRVLMIEDAAEVRMLVRFVLEDSGFAVDEAEDGAGGLAAARTLPDLVLLDVQLPDLDGPDVLARLQADPHTAGIRVAFLTAGHSKADDHLLALGAVGVLRKPVDLATFPDQLATLL